MKILHIISHYKPAIKMGGPLQVVSGLSSELLNRNVEVVVICTNIKDDKSYLNTNIDEPIYIDGVKVFYQEINYLRYWGYSKNYKKRIYKEAKNCDLIITHFHYQYASVIGGKIARKLNIPYFVFTHGSLNKNSYNGIKSIYKYIYINTIEKYNFSKANKIIYHSNAEYEQSIKYKNYSIVPLGVNEEEFNYKTNQTNNVELQDVDGHDIIITYVGRIAEGKGLDLLIKSLHCLIRKNIKNIKLIIIGGDERNYLENLKQLIIKYDIEDYVIFTGVLTGKEKVKILYRSNIFSLTSRSEGTSLATLESMYMGLPVLVTNRVGLHKEIKKYNAGLVCDYDVESITDNLFKLIKTNDREKLGINGKNYVKENYTWKIIVDNFIKLFKELNT